jgi:acetyl esterase
MLRTLLPLAFLVCAAAPAAMHNDVEFAKVGDVSLTLDAWVPDGEGPFAAVVIVHGGGFVRGDKQTYVKPLFEPLTKAGFAWFTINYRLAPKYKFPAAAEDVERAVIYVRSHARQYKVDPNRIALMGESAGGHLVSYVGAHGKPEARVAAVVSFYGPHDFESRARSSGSVSDGLKGFLGIAELNEDAYAVLRKASPITYVHKGMPPYLLIHGTKDAMVPYEQSVKMCEKMRASSASCELFTVEGAGHGIGGWEKNPALQAYKRKMVEWLTSLLGRRATHSR